jgi:hypothetical protein
MSCRRLLAHAGALGIGLSAMLASGADAALPCIEMPDGCRVALDRTRERELAFVQQAVNASIRPAGDMEGLWRDLGDGLIRRRPGRQWW